MQCVLVTTVVNTGRLFAYFDHKNNFLTLNFTPRIRSADHLLFITMIKMTCSLSGMRKRCKVQN